MADEQHLALVKQGVDVWNDWRKKNAILPVDLSEAAALQHLERRATLRM